MCAAPVIYLKVKDLCKNRTNDPLHNPIYRIIIHTLSFFSGKDNETTEGDNPVRVFSALTLTTCPWLTEYNDKLLKLVYDDSHHFVSALKNTVNTASGWPMTNSVYLEHADNWRANEIWLQVVF